MTLKRMENVLRVVDALEALKAFFIELGLAVEAKPGGCRACVESLRHPKQFRGLAQFPVSKGYYSIKIDCTARDAARERV